jgi:hypothetical protein
MIRRAAPSAYQKFHCAVFLNCNATPVSRQTYRLQGTLAVSPVLTAQHPRSFLACSAPTDVDKVDHANACIRWLSDIGVLPLSK